MTLTTAQQVRLRIQDIPAIADVTRNGDGLSTIYNLEHRNLSSGTAFVPITAGWSATAGAVFNITGYAELSGVVSANSAIRFRYVHSVFSDDEIGHFTTVGGTVAGAALEAVGALMFDGLKRAKWAAPDGSSFDDTMAISQLQKLWEQLKDEKSQSDAVAGDFASWSLGQADW